MGRAALGTFSALLIGCSGGVEVPLELSGGELVVLGWTEDESFRIEFQQPEIGAPVRVKADPDTPVYTFVLRPEDFITPAGAPVALDTAKIRLATAPANEGGDCGRCQAPSATGPQVVNPGDSCAISPFIDAALWEPNTSGLSCRGALDSKLCAPGDEAQRALIEEVRSAVRLDWPGGCACELEPPSFSLRRLDLQPVSPVEAPQPLGVFAQDASGRLAGFSDRVTWLHDPTNGTSQTVPLENFPGVTRAAVAHREGGFLVASEEFNTGFYSQYVFHRFSVQGDRLGPPMALAGSDARPRKMRYLGSGNFPLYLIGNAETSLSQLEPAMFACNDNSLSCRRVSLTRCMNESRLGPLTEIEILPNGAGIAMANTALYLKPPNPPPEENPQSTDTWTCTQPEGMFERLDGSPGLRVRDFGSMTALGDRVFVCGQSQVDACDYSAAVVLTATVSGAPGELPQPDWKVAYEGAPGSFCRRFLPSPNPQQVRLRLTGFLVVDLDADAQVVQELDLPSVYGPSDGLLDLVGVGPDTVLSRTVENRIYLGPSGGPLTQVYGAPQREGSAYLSLVALPDGRFLLPGHLDKIGVLDPDGASRPEALTATDEVFAPARIEDAVLDTAYTGAGLAVMVVGSRDDQPLLSRVVIEGDRITSERKIATPAAVDGLSLLGIAEASPGQFVVMAQGTQLLRIVDDRAEMLEIDFDDPLTEAQESRPFVGPDSCSGQTPRLDAFRDIAGGHGVVWVVGLEGLLFRVVQDQVERWAAPENVALTAVQARCPDAPVFAGRGNFTSQAGIANLRMAFYVLAEPEEEDARRPQTLLQVGEDDLIGVNIDDVIQGIPRAILLDAQPTTGPRTPFGVVLRGGLLHRMFSGGGIEQILAPFAVQSVAQSADGTVLMGGFDANLALGRPQP